MKKVKRTTMLNFKIMKKGLIAIITLLTVGVISAQSKKDLQKEFENLEKQMEQLSEKYDAKLQKFEENQIYKVEDKLEADTNFDESNFKDEDFKDFDKNFGTEEAMKMFVEIYETNIKENEIALNELEKNDKNQKVSANEKEYFKTLNEYEVEATKIEKKMYEVAKKYFSKK